MYHILYLSNLTFSLTGLSTCILFSLQYHYIILYYIIIKVICGVNKGIDDQLNTLRDEVQITPTCQEMYGDTPSSLENIAVR